MSQQGMTIVDSRPEIVIVTDSNGTCPDGYSKTVINAEYRFRNEGFNFNSRRPFTSYTAWVTVKPTTQTGTVGSYDTATWDEVLAAGSVSYRDTILRRTITAEFRGGNTQCTRQPHRDFFSVDEDYTCPTGYTKLVVDAEYRFKYVGFNFNSNTSYTLYSFWVTVKPTTQSGTIGSYDTVTWDEVLAAGGVSYSDVNLRRTTTAEIRGGTLSCLREY